MAFCKFCGKEIIEGEQCDCSESQSAAQENTAPSAAPEATAEKPSNNAAIVLAAALVIILVIIISLVSSIAGGGYKKPVNDFEKALNKADGKLLAECMYGDDMLDELDKDDYEDLSTTIEWLVEMCEEEVGDDVKFTIKIEDKEKLKKSELKDIEETYSESYDMDVKVKKGYVLEGTFKIKGDDDKEEEDIELTVVKIKGDGWKISPDSAMGSMF